MEGVTGVVVSARYTAYQIKLKLAGGRDMTLWKRKFASQWGGRKNSEGALQQALCDAEGDSCVPVLAPGVSVTLTRDASHANGRAGVFCVLSVAAPTSEEAHSGRMRSYTSAVTAWVSLASRKLLSEADLQSVPELVKHALTGQTPPGKQTDKDETVAGAVVREALSLIRAAVSRVNIRSTLQQDLHGMNMAVPTAEMDTLCVAMDNYDSFRANPFDAHMGGGKHPLFKTLDTFASAYGLSPSYRGVAAVAYKLRMMLKDGGHACCPAADLIAAPMLEWTSDEVRASIVEGLRLRVLALDGLGGEDIYLQHVYATEAGVGARISALAHGGRVGAWANRVALQVHASLVEQVMSSDELCLQLDSVQRGAVLTALTGKKDVLVLSGYPGTGKSRVSQALRNACRHLGLVMMVCAPTAKAASRLGEGAMTVHRALGAVPSRTGFRFTHNEEQPLDADVVLVDEVSMLDMSVAYALLRACDPARTRIILVGDANQLPSVEWGDLLGALMESDVPRIFLERIYRQDTAGNTIWPLAKSIADGGPLLRSDLRSESVSWVTDESLAGVSAALIALHAEHGDNMQIISPSRRHGLHTGLLNEAILDRPARHWDARFDVGDRIVVIRNQAHTPSKGDSVPFMNGDCGAVLSVDTTVATSDSRRVVVCLDGDRTGAVSSTDLEHAYALTTHKAQGSEYDVVALVMSAQQGRALNRQALYTSVSRAVRKLYIFAGRDTLSRCVGNLSEPRQGHLRERINGRV